MLQRIQSLYLLIAAMLLILTNYLPIAESLDDPPTLTHICELANPLFYIFWFIAVAILGSIFLFKNRTLQVRTVTILSIAVLGLSSWLIWFIFDRRPDDEYAIWVWLPFLSVILLSMAVRNIKKDERLVRSMNRMRG